MRIIGGVFKGKKIEFVKSSVTRPLKDLVKESIFNIINHSKIIRFNLIRASVLDLYSGIGSFGIECISRGIKNITFVEKDSNVIKILKKNLISLSALESANIINSDTKDYFKKLDNKNKFEIVFLDPPFADKENFIQDLIYIKKLKILTDNHIVIIHRESKSLDNLDNIIKIILTKKYGRSKIIFGKV
tara:strand:+ start:742 stop:1305 length:564 start_codon:yes stop_codon:yes gene_type:complete